MDFFFISIILGACIGSFINVISIRIPKNKPFIISRSKCPRCENKLNIFDLVPIFSWIFLRGKCRYCYQNISIRYPVIELFTCFLFLCCRYSYGFIYFSDSLTFNLITGWLLVSFLITLTIIDIDTMTLPNSITYTGLITGLTFILIKDIFFTKELDTSFQEHFFAFIISFIVISFFAFFLKLFLKKEVFGGGDSKLIAMCAAWLGFTGIEVTVTLSFLIGGIFSALLLTSRKIKRGDFIPFGPFICVSSFLVWMFGSDFWYELLGNIFWWKYL